MTNISARRLALGAAAVTVLGTVTAVSPALAASPSYPVVCASAQQDAPRDVVTTFTLSCEDTEGNPVDSYVVLTAPTKAQSFAVDSATGEVTYRSLPDAVGTDTFTFKGVVEGLGESAPTTATIALENGRPVCAPVADLSVVHGRSVVVPLECEDPDGDALTVSTGTTGAAHGAAVVEDGEVVYTPAAGFVGEDTFSLRATDGDLLSEEVMVAVSVTNAQPTCAGAAGTTVHGRAASFALSCADADGDALTRSVTAAAQHGTVTLQGNAVTYRPAAGFVGTDTFTVGATDGLSASAPARFTVQVTNAIPTCNRGGKVKVKGKSAPVKVSCSDADGDDVKVTVAKAPRHGKVVDKGEKWVYVADKGYRGKDSFKLAATDGVATSKPVGYSVTVKPSRRR